MSDMSASSPWDMATGGAHGNTTPFRGWDHANVLGLLMIAGLLILGVIHFAFGFNVNIGR